MKKLIYAARGGSLDEVRRRRRKWICKKGVCVWGGGENVNLRYPVVNMSDKM